MRTSTAVLSVLTIALLGCYGYKLTANYAQPSVYVVDGVVFDAGIVAPALPITHVFKVENPNSFAEQVAAPVVGCACTTSTVSASVIQAHGSVDVKLRVEPEDGEFSGSASLTTTHGGNAVETLLFVTATARPLPR